MFSLGFKPFTGFQRLLRWKITTLLMNKATAPARTYPCLAHQSLDGTVPLHLSSCQIGLFSFYQMFHFLSSCRSFPLAVLSLWVQLHDYLLRTDLPHDRLNPPESLPKVLALRVSIPQPPRISFLPMQIHSHFPGDLTYIWRGIKKRSFGQPIKKNNSTPLGQWAPSCSVDFTLHIIKSLPSRESAWNK